MHAQEWGRNGAVKASTSSWDDGEDPGGVRRSCGGTRVYRLGLEKTEIEHHCRTGNDAMAGGGKLPKETD
jgi:hypothetical protein